MSRPSTYLVVVRRGVEARDNLALERGLAAGIGLKNRCLFAGDAVRRGRWDANCAKGSRR